MVYQYLEPAPAGPYSLNQPLMAAPFPEQYETSGQQLEVSRGGQRQTGYGSQRPPYGSQAEQSGYGSQPGGDSYQQRAYGSQGSFDQWVGRH